MMTDRELIEDIARFVGTLKRRTKRSSYIGERRLVFDDGGDLTIVMERNIAGLWVATGRAHEK